MKLGMPSRSRARTRTSSLSQQSVETAEPGILAARWKRLAELVLHALPQRDQEVLVRLYVDEQPPADICAALGLTDAQFRLIRTRAENRLAALFRSSASGRTQTPSKEVRGARDEGVDTERFVPVVAHAIAVFGDEQKTSHWFATPLPLFDGRSPAQVLASKGGPEWIDQILTRIEYNIPS
jgi:uncharacterized protein (DUF2384 family)